jgi:hypothetical protein
MSSDAPAINGARERHGVREDGQLALEHPEDQLIMHLERDQTVAETSIPVPRAALGARAVAGLWALRVFVVIVSIMVIYTFVDQLH